MLKRDGESEKFAKGIPPKMILRGKLLDVFRRRPSRPGLEQSSPIHKRNNGEHLRAGSYLENGKEIGKVVSQDIAGYGDGILPHLESFECKATCVDRRQNANIE